MADGYASDGQIQEAIDRIRGVIGSRVVMAEQVSGQGSAAPAIDEIHVLASINRPAKRVVRDVESVLLAQFGIRVDHKKISVAQIAAAGGEISPRERARLEGLQLEVERGQLAMSVRVGIGSRQWTGTARGADAILARPRLAATAALRALEEALGGQGRLQLDDLVRFSLGGWSGLLAAVTLTDASGEEALVGGALQRRDELDAAVKAVLNAVNRRFDREREM